MSGKISKMLFPHEKEILENDMGLEKECR